MLSLIKNKNIDIIVISGAPSEILSIYKERLGIDDIFALQLEILDGKYNGNILINPGISDIKRKVINKLLKNSDQKVVISFGNSSSDLPLFESSPLNIIINNRNLKISNKAFYIQKDNNVDNIIKLINFKITN